LTRGIPLDPMTVFQNTPSSAPKKVMVVFFIGGVTFMEIAAIRFLSESADCKLLTERERGTHTHIVPLLYF
jgi:hypothetical protein